MASLSGRTEIDVFKNYYKENGDGIRARIAQMTLSSKDDEKSALASVDVDQDFQAKNYYICIGKFTESLLHATYNSQAYAAALHKRSAIFFTIENFEKCAIDLKLCLEADYPKTEKPALYIEMATCYAKMENLEYMLRAIDDCYNFMKNCPELSEESKTGYVRQIETIMRTYNSLNLGGTQLVQPSLEPAEIKEPHASNPNVSSSLKIKFNNASDTDYIAARDIPCGEVLFLEKAYSHGFYVSTNRPIGYFFCDYCMAEASNCIPCRTCVTYLYCSENCRINAWNEYHQWECDITRARFLPNVMILALRTVIKAACSGSTKEIISKKSIKPGKNADPYLNLYGIVVDLAYLRVNHGQGLLSCCENSVFMVEFLKKSNFISHLMSTTLKNLSSDAVVDHIGGLLLRHSIQAYQRSVTVNRPSHPFALLDDNKEQIVLSCIRYEKFNAFCPIISGITYSCLCNTFTDFQGCTAVVKASKDIKAGDPIYRNTLNLSPNNLHPSRDRAIKSLMINCKCESCADARKNCDIYNTFLCTVCKGHALLEHIGSNPSLCCIDCKTKSPGLLIALQLGGYNLARDTEDLDIKVNYLETLKTIANPHHMYVYVLHKDILHLRSVEGDTQLFREALENFKTCTKIKNNYGNQFNYLNDLLSMCEAFFRFLYINKVALREEEGLELVNMFFELIEEGKNLSVITFPPFLQLFNSVEVYLLSFRINHIYLKL